MKVTVCINDTKIVVPCGDGDLSVRQLAELAIIRYRKTVLLKTNQSGCIEINSLRLARDGGMLDWDDKVQHVLDDRDLLIAQNTSITTGPNNVLTNNSRKNIELDEFGLSTNSIYAPRHNSIPCSDQDAMRMQLDIMKESTTSSGVRHESLDNILDIPSSQARCIYTHQNSFNRDYEKWPLPPFPTNSTVNSSTLQSSKEATIKPVDHKLPADDHAWDDENIDDDDDEDGDEEDYPRLRPDYIVKHKEYMARLKYEEETANKSSIALHTVSANSFLPGSGVVPIATTTSGANVIGSGSSISGNSPNTKEVIQWLASQQHDCNNPPITSTKQQQAQPCKHTNQSQHSTTSNSASFDERNHSKTFISCSSSASSKNDGSSNKISLTVESFSKQLFDNCITVRLLNHKLGENLGIKIRPWYNSANISDTEQRTLFGIEVYSIVPGGRVDKEGQFTKGDRIIQINDATLIGLSFERAERVFRESLLYAECRLKVVPNNPLVTQLLPPIVPSSTPSMQTSAAPVSPTPSVTSPLTITTSTSNNLPSLSSQNYQPPNISNTSASSVQPSYPPPPPKRSPNISMIQQNQPQQPVPPVKAGVPVTTTTTTTTTTTSCPTKPQQQVVPSYTSGVGSMIHTPASSTSSVSHSAPQHQLPNPHQSQSTTDKSKDKSTYLLQKHQHQQPKKSPSNKAHQDNDINNNKVTKEPNRHEIELTKTSSGFGFSITEHTTPDKQSAVYVRYILKDGAAIRDGKLREGDKLVEIDGLILRNMNQTDVITLLREKPNGGRVKLVVERLYPCSSDLAGRSKKWYSQSQHHHHHGLSASHDSLITSLSELEEDGSTLSKGRHSGGREGARGNDHFSSGIHAQSGVVSSKEQILKLDIPLNYPSVSSQSPASSTTNAGDRPTLGVSVKVEPDLHHLHRITSANKTTSKDASDHLDSPDTSNRKHQDAIDASNIVQVKTVIENGAAHRDGRLKVGDQILRVNDQSLSGLSSNEALTRLKDIIKTALDSADSVIRMDIKRKINMGRSSSLNTLNSMTGSGSMTSYVPSFYEQNRSYLYSDNGSFSDKQSSVPYNVVGNNQATAGGLDEFCIDRSSADDGIFSMPPPTNLDRHLHHHEYSNDHHHHHHHQVTSNIPSNNTSSHVSNIISVPVQHHTPIINATTSVAQHSRSNQPVNKSEKFDAHSPLITQADDPSSLPHSQSIHQPSMTATATSSFEDSSLSNPSNYYTNIPQFKHTPNHAHNVTMNTTTVNTNTKTTKSVTPNTKPDPNLSTVTKTSYAPPLIRRLKKHDSDDETEESNEYMNQKSYDYLDEDSVRRDLKKPRNSNEKSTINDYNYPCFYSPPKNHDASRGHGSSSHPTESPMATNTLCRHQTNNNREARARHARSNCSMVTPTNLEDKQRAQHIDEVDWSKMEFMPFDRKAADEIIRRKGLDHGAAIHVGRKDENIDKVKSRDKTHLDDNKTSPPHHQSAIHLGRSDCTGTVTRQRSRTNKDTKPVIKNMTHGSQPTINSNSQSKNPTKKTRFKRITYLLKHSLTNQNNSQKSSNSAGSSPISARKTHNKVVVIRDTVEGSDLGYRPSSNSINIGEPVNDKGQFPTSNSTHSIRSNTTDKSPCHEYPYADLDFIYTSKAGSPPVPPIRSVTNLASNTITSSSSHFPLLSSSLIQSFRPAPPPPSISPTLIGPPITSHNQSEFNPSIGIQCSSSALISTFFPPPPPLTTSFSSMSSISSIHNASSHHFYQKPPCFSENAPTSHLMPLPEESFITSNFNCTNYPLSSSNVGSPSIAQISPFKDHGNIGHFSKLEELINANNDDDDSDSYDDFEDVQAVVPGYMSAVKRIAAAMPNKPPTNRYVYEDAEELFQSLQINSNYSSDFTLTNTKTTINTNNTSNISSKLDQLLSNTPSSQNKHQSKQSQASASTSTSIQQNDSFFNSSSLMMSNLSHPLSPIIQPKINK